MILISSSVIVPPPSSDKSRAAMTAEQLQPVKLFGNSLFIKVMLFLRAVIGFGSIAFSFLAAEYISIGDSTVLIMLSPMIASIASYLLLGESWRVPEFVATILSIIGAILVAKPAFIFGEQHDNDGYPSHGSDSESTSSSSASSDSSGTSSHDFTVGVLCGLSAALFAGFAFICVRVLGTTAKMPWANVCFSQALAQILLSPPCLIIAGQSFNEIFELTPWEYFLIFAGGFIGAWSQISMTLGMQREKSATATAMRMSDVVFGFIWQMLFTPDPISYLSVLGALLVTGSIMVVVIFKPSNPDTSSVTNASSSVAKATIELADIDSSSHAMLHKFRIEDEEEDEEDLDTIQLYHHSMKAKVLGGSQAYRQISVVDGSIESPIHRKGVSRESNHSPSNDSMDGVEIARVSSTDIEHGRETPLELQSDGQDEWRETLQGGDHHFITATNGKGFIIEDELELGQ